MTESVQALETAAGVASNLPVRDRTQTGGWKPYPAYKDSGMEWLGRVPETWDCLPHRAMFEEVLDRGHPDAPLLSVTIGRGVIPQSALLSDSSKKDSSNTDKSKYKLVRPGDLAYNKMRAWQGAVGVSSHTGIISPAYVVVRPRRPQNTRFYHYLFRTPAFATEAERWSYGITSDQWSLRAEDFKRIYSVIPPPAEQDAIVRFLDYHDRLIRKYIRAKQKLIALLTEQKQAIIQHAVTRGLNPDVKLKPSGVDWLGDIPEHWEARKLRSLFAVQGSGTTPNGEEYYGGEIPWVITGDLNDGRVCKTKRHVTTNALQEIGALRIYPAGSLMVAMYGATIGKTGLLGMDACTNQACCVLACPTKDCNAVFAQAVVISSRQHLIQQAYGGGQPNINAGVVKSLRVPHPPIAEQDEIVEYITEVTTSIHAGIAGAQRQIALMREYRTRLTADVVTGKIDVRDLPAASAAQAGAAAALPDGLPDEEPADDDPGYAEAAEEEAEEGGE